MERKEIAIFLQVLLILFRISDSFLSRNITIIRKVGQKGDEFQVPSSILSSGGCSQLGAEDRKCNSNSCRCQCVPSRATFISSKGKWSCIKDETIRKQERCGIFFHEEGPGDPFLVRKDDFSLMLKGIKSAKPSCGLARKRERYLDCNGSWAALTSRSAGRVFSFSKLQQAKVFAVLTIQSPGVQFANGKLIKLWFTEGCELVNKSLNKCLIFKQPGTMSCRVLGPILKETSSTLASSTYDKKSKQGNIYSTKQSGPTSSLTSTYTKVLPKDEGSNKVGTLKVFAGIVPAVAILALIVVTFFILRHRKKSKENHSINHNSGTHEVQDDGLVYDYAQPEMSMGIIGNHSNVSPDLHEGNSVDPDSHILEGPDPGHTRNEVPTYQNVEQPKHASTCRLVTSNNISYGAGSSTAEDGNSLVVDFENNRQLPLVPCTSDTYQTIKPIPHENSEYTGLVVNTDGLNAVSQHTYTNTPVYQDLDEKTRRCEENDENRYQSLVKVADK